MDSSKSVLLVGPTGSGKSFLANQIFSFTQTPLKFESSSSILSTTKEAQSGLVNYKGQVLKIIDFPGVYDVSGQSNSEEIEGLNLCKFINILSECQGIVAIIFVYQSPRFSEPIKIWYDRIMKIIPNESKALKVLLLENQCFEMDEKTNVKMHLEIQKYLCYNLSESLVPYFRYSFCSTPQDGTKNTAQLLDLLLSYESIKVNNPIIPQMCYKNKEEGETFEEVISNTERDEGSIVTTTRIEPYETQEERWDGDFGKIFGFKKVVTVRRERSITESIFVPKLVTYREIAIFKNVYNKRYDGKKDLDCRIEVGRRTVII